MQYDLIHNKQNKIQNKDERTEWRGEAKIRDKKREEERVIMLVVKIQSDNDCTK